MISHSKLVRLQAELGSPNSAVLLINREPSPARVIVRLASALSVAVAACGVSGSALAVIVLSLHAPQAIAARCSQTIVISPGYWQGCPDKCVWVPPKEYTVWYDC